MPRPSLLSPLLPLCLFAGLAPVLGHAQQSPPPPSKEGLQWSLWGGGSVANGHVFGFAKNRRLDVLGLRLALPLKQFQFEESTLSYKMELLPVAVLTEPALVNDAGAALASRRRYVYGAGAAPVGAEFDLRKHHPLQPFVETTGGFLYFQDRVFSPRASQFNFTIDLGGGLRLVPRHGPNFIIGYQYLHVSNANISHRNPGADFQMIYIGFGGMAAKRH